MYARSRRCARPSGDEPDTARTLSCSRRHLRLNLNRHAVSAAERCAAAKLVRVIFGTCHKRHHCANPLLPHALC